MLKKEIEKFIRKGFIVKIQGKPYIRYEGLLSIAEERGLISIETELVQLDMEKHFAQFKCTAKAQIMKDGAPHFDAKGDPVCRTFVSYGDGSSKNINRGVISSFLRVCETRSKARALRDLCGIGMCSVEELPDENAMRVEKKKNGYHPRTDPEFAKFCEAFGGYELLRENIINNFDEDLDQLPKSRIVKLMVAVESGMVQLEIDADR